VYKPYFLGKTGHKVIDVAAAAAAAENSRKHHDNKGK
jgi:hypothetical protein